MPAGPTRSRRPTSMMRPDVAAPAAPVAEPPEAPLGAGPGAGLTGGLSIVEEPWPPAPAGGPGVEPVRDAATAARLVGAEGSRRSPPGQPSMQVSAGPHPNEPG